MPRPLRRSLQLALGLLAACAAPTAQRPARAGPAPADFFPLEVGNTWTYLDRSAQQPATTHHTVRIVRRDPDGYYVDDQRGAFRADADCLHDRVRRLLCAPIAVGNGWSSVVSVSSTERYEVAGVGEAVKTPAGSFAGCVRVRAHNRASATTAQVLEITYAPGVGPVRIETFVVVDGKASPQVRALLRSYRVEGR